MTGKFRPLFALACSVFGAALTVGLLWVTGQLGTSATARQEPPQIIRPDEGAPAGEPPSDKAVFISAARQQLIGVRTAEIGRKKLDATIRTVGVLAYDETRVAEVHTKVAGWIESVAVDFVGKSIRRGLPLFTVYSPDLVQAQAEYLLALKSQDQLGSSRIEQTREGAASLLVAARERLRLWDVTDAQIAELERTRQPRRTMPFYSPFDGVVLERNAFPGQYVTPEVKLFRIADLSTIWALAQVFESELSFVKIGQPARIEFPHDAGTRSLTGRITFVYPEIDPTTRRVKVRVELPNPGLQFKPESYVTVTIQTGGGERLAIPREAVIDTGSKRYAILALPDGYFEPREINVGEARDDFHPLVSGLKAGDRVVTSAQFLIDSETNLQAAMQAMTQAPDSTLPVASTAPTPTNGMTAEVQATPAAIQMAYLSQPDPPHVGENTFEVSVKDASGAPVTDAHVTVTFSMPAMPSMGMPAMKSSANLTHVGAGVYRGTGQIVMASRWDVTVAVDRAGSRLGTKRLSVLVK